MTQVPSEHIEQVTFINWMRDNHPDIFIFAIPNGDFRNITVAKRLKAEGVVAGVPDLFIPALNTFIEMKKQKAGTVSKAQKEIIPILRNSGHMVIIAKGYQDAIDQIQPYLSNVSI